MFGLKYKKRNIREWFAKHELITRVVAVIALLLLPIAFFYWVGLLVKDNFSELKTEVFCVLSIAFGKWED